MPKAPWYHLSVFPQTFDVDVCVIRNPVRPLFTSLSSRGLYTPLLSGARPRSWSKGPAYKMCTLPSQATSVRLFSLCRPWLNPSPFPLRRPRFWRWRLETGLAFVRWHSPACIHIRINVVPSPSCSYACRTYARFPSKWRNHLGCCAPTYSKCLPITSIICVH